jgi:hypothetical protein
VTWRLPSLRSYPRCPECLDLYAGRGTRANSAAGVITICSRCVARRAAEPEPEADPPKAPRLPRCSACRRPYPGTPTRINTDAGVTRICPRCALRRSGFFEPPP